MYHGCIGQFAQEFPVLFTFALGNGEYRILDVTIDRFAILRRVQRLLPRGNGTDLFPQPLAVGGYADVSGAEVFRSVNINGPL